MGSKTVRGMPFRAVHVNRARWRSQLASFHRSSFAPDLLTHIRLSTHSYEIRFFASIDLSCSMFRPRSTPTSTAIAIPRASIARRNKIRPPSQPRLCCQIWPRIEKQTPNLKLYPLLFACHLSDVFDDRTTGVRLRDDRRR